MIERRLPARTRPLIVGILLIFLGACAHAPDDDPPTPPDRVAVHDPAEPVNRAGFGFNRVLVTGASGGIRSTTACTTW